MPRINHWFGGVSLLCVGVMGIILTYGSFGRLGVVVSDEMASEIRGGGYGCAFGYINPFVGCGLQPPTGYCAAGPLFIQGYPNNYLVSTYVSCDQSNPSCGSYSVSLVCSFP